jgi:eukaryotic-like serine/threonine-protein kinase
MKVCPECAGSAYGSPTQCAECGHNLAEIDSISGDDLSGAVIERKYRLVDCIGEGAMGWVYRGVHLALDSSVAVKLMKPSAEQNSTNDKRFAREARAASRLNNPHIISITDFGRTPGGVLFIVSEYLRGITLSELIENDGALPVPRALHIADQLLSGLDEAHSASLVHRDLKPDNLMITPLRSGEDFVKILDFGIAKLNTSDAAKLTHQGEVIGTPTYMAPEQIRGKDVTPQTDLYACGAMIYEMLTGIPPFDSESVMEVLGMHLSQEPRPLREVAPDKQISEVLEKTVLRALAKDPADRFKTADELRQALSNVATTQSDIQQECPVCGHPRPGSAKFCEECGAQLRMDSMAMIPVSARTPKAPSSVSVTGETIYAVHDDGTPMAAAQPDTVVDVPSPRPGPLAIPRDTLQRRLRAEKTLRFDLVGRTEETAQLQTFFDSDWHIAEILAPEGSGRTRLLREAGAMAMRLGITPIWVTPDPSLARTPWHAVRKLVAAVLQLSEAPDLASIEGSVAAYDLTADDVRGLAELFGLAQPDSYVEHAVRLRETRASALRVLRFGYSADVTLCVLIDDADELDGASRTFFRDLSDSIGESPLKMILTGETSILPSERSQLQLAPGPFEQLHVGQLLDGLPRKKETWSGLLQVILRRSEGNPLWVVQAIRLLVEGGTEVDAPLGDIVSTRISRLPSEARELLQIVSVIGLGARVDRVQHLLDMDEDRLTDAIALLVRRHLLVEGPSAMLTVGHPLIARTVRESMPADARETLHRQILEFLETHGGAPIALARHAAAAKLGEDALYLLVEAGKASERMLDDIGAANQYRHALQIARWQLLIDETDEVCLDLSLRLANSLRYSGDNVAAEMVLKESIQHATTDPAWHARLLHSMALLELSKGDPTEAVDTMQYAVRQAFFSARPALLNQMYIDLGKVLDQAGQGMRAAEELAEGVLVVTSGDGPEAQKAPVSFWRLLAQLADLKFRQGEAAEAFKTVSSALSQAKRQGSRIGQARCHYLMARCLDRMNRSEAADEHHAIALTAFRRLGDRRSAVEVLLSRASTAPAERTELMQQALTLSRQIDWEPGIRAASALSIPIPTEN